MRARAGRVARRPAATTMLVRVPSRRCEAEASGARRRGGNSAAGKRRSVGRVAGGVAPAEMPVATGHALALWRPLPTDGRRRQSSWATTWANRLGHCADMNGAPLTRTPPRRSWGRGPPPPGWRRIQARRATCLLRVFYCELCSAPTGRVPGLRGAFIIASTPCSCVGVGDQHSGIVVCC